MARKKKTVVVAKIALGIFIGELLISAAVLSADRLKFASSIRINPLYILPPLAAQEIGFWKDQGLEVDWIAFEAGGYTDRALAAGAIDAGLSTAPNLIRGRAMRLPSTIVADLEAIQPWHFWVRADSPIRQENDFRGGKIGIPRIGTPNHIYAKAVGRQLGLEKELRFVALGPIPQQIAALKTKAVDGIVLSTFEMLDLEMEGVVRRVVDVSKFLPQEWTDLVVFARTDFMERNPLLIDRAVKAVFRSTAFIMKNPAWSIEKMKTESRYSERVAREIYRGLRFSKDGTIRRNRLENVLNFLIDYGLISPDKAPHVDEVYTERFVPAG